MVFISQTHLYFVRMHYLANMFRLTIESSSGPYIKIHILSHSKCVLGSFVLTFKRLMTYIYIYIYIYMYICRTAPLTSRCCILYIYSTNIRTEYFKHAAHSPFFPLQNAVYFIMLTFWFLYYSHFKYRVC